MTFYCKGKGGICHDTKNCSVCEYLDGSGGYKVSEKTNAEHIRGMTDEELADLLEGERGNMLPGTALAWLQQLYNED